MAVGVGTSQHTFLSLYDIHATVATVVAVKKWSLTQ